MSSTPDNRDPRAAAAVMEARYRLPYNWVIPAYSIRWAHKIGLCDIVASFVTPGDRLLDVGCGDGWHSRRFQEAGAQVSGIDLSERAIGFARLILPDAEFSVGSAASLPFPDASFDVVTCIQVLEHMTVEDGKRALDEMRRVLKPGGKMVISVPSVLRPMSKAHLRHYTVNDLRTLLAPYGEIRTVVGHELHNGFTLGLRKLFDNRFVFAPWLSKIFYRGWYFRHCNRVAPERANNLVACVQRRP